VVSSMGCPVSKWMNGAMVQGAAVPASGMRPKAVGGREMQPRRTKRGAGPRPRLGCRNMDKTSLWRA
jgi:hypothetical protein